MHISRPLPSAEAGALPLNPTLLGGGGGDRYKLGDTRIATGGLGLSPSGEIRGTPTGVGQCVSGRQGPLVDGFTGTALVIATSGLLLLLDAPSSVPQVPLVCFGIGLGLGLVAGPTIIAARVSVSWRERGVVTGTNPVLPFAGQRGGRGGVRGSRQRDVAQCRRRSVRPALDAGACPRPRTMCSSA
ncbi:MAG: hypothetical protein QOC73_983 [Actinomycetota bacterium]|nr:hypothetical protein [Actinomycetota bacterium]